MLIIWADGHGLHYLRPTFAVAGWRHVPCGTDIARNRDAEPVRTLLGLPSLAQPTHAVAVPTHFAYAPGLPLCRLHERAL